MNAGWEAGDVLAALRRQPAVVQRLSRAVSRGWPARRPPAAPSGSSCRRPSYRKLRKYHNERAWQERAMRARRRFKWPRAPSARQDGRVRVVRIPAPSSHTSCAGDRRSRKVLCSRCPRSTDPSRSKAKGLRAAWLSARALLERPGLSTPWCSRRVRSVRSRHLPEVDLMSFPGPSNEARYRLVRRPRAVSGVPPSSPLLASVLLTQPTLLAAYFWAAAYSRGRAASPSSGAHRRA